MLATNIHSKFSFAAIRVQCQVADNGGWPLNRGYKLVQKLSLDLNNWALNRGCSRHKRGSPLVLKPREKEKYETSE